MEIKFFKKEKKFKKGNSEFNVKPFWKLAVLFMFIVALLSFFFGYYLFVQINKEPVPITSSGGNQAEVIKKDRIDKVLEYFSKREEKSIQILNSPAPVIDPSF